LALDCGLDVAAWDADKLVDADSVGTYQAYMNSPIEAWKKLLVHGTGVYAYINCSVQTGQYFGLEEYRAAAANAYGSGADGIYLFNYPCLFELAFQVPSPVAQPEMKLSDLRAYRQADLSKVGLALDEIGRAESLAGQDKRFLFNFSNELGYRHFAPVLAGLDRAGRERTLKAPFRCYEDYQRTRAITLRFKIENVARTEEFQVSLNGRPLDAAQQEVRYAGNGRDTRLHTVNLGPYLEYTLSLRPNQLKKGENLLEVTPKRLIPELQAKINLVEIELLVSYGKA
jgi:hypothetical protein